MGRLNSAARRKELLGVFLTAHPAETDDEWARLPPLSDARSDPHLFLTTVRHDLAQLQGRIPEGDAYHYVQGLGGLPAWLRDNKDGFSEIDAAVSQVMFMAEDSAPLQSLYKSFLRGAQNGFNGESQTAYHIHRGVIPDCLSRLLTTRAELDTAPLKLYVAIAALLMNQSVDLATESIMMQIKADRAIRASKIINVNYSKYYLFLNKHLPHARHTTEVFPERVRLAAALHLLMAGESRAVTNSTTIPVRKLLFGEGLTESFMEQMLQAEADSIEEVLGK